jgi:D-lactate dehydrogenase
LDIFFYEVFEEEGQALKRYIPPHIAAGFSCKTIQEHGNITPPAFVISIRTQSIIPTSWAPKLSGILTRSSGYNHIVAYRQKSKKNIPCGCLPSYCSRSVAEQTMLLWMSLLRKLPQQISKFSHFHRDGLTGLECEHKTLLVVGVGNIGYEIVRIGNGLGMEVLGVDIIKKYSSVSYVSIEQGLARANIIVCAMNLTSDNLGYFNYQMLKKAEPGAIFVNIARGEMSPSADLLRLLDENHLAGVALDVYNQESELAVSLRTGRSSSNKEVQATLALSKRENVILTPHNAFNTREAVDKKAKYSIQQIEHFFEKGNFIWPVPI